MDSISQERSSEELDLDASEGTPGPAHKQSEDELQGESSEVHEAGEEVVSEADEEIVVREEGQDAYGMDEEE